MGISDAAGLLFKIRSDSSQSSADIKRLRAIIAKEIGAVEGEFKKAGNAAEDFDGKTKKLSSGLDSFGGNLAANAVSNLTSALLQGGKAVLDYSSRLEQTKIGFTSLLGNADKANKLLREIETFAKDTPFEFQGITELSQRLLGANVEAEKVIPLMRDIGNIVSATGEASQARLEGVTVALTQMISKQKVSAEEMEQLAERGINGFDLLSQATGKTQAELRKLAEQGGISSDLMVKALQKISREKFGDAMEKQSKTFSGAMSSIKDTLLISAATAFEPLFKKISEVGVNISKEMNKLKSGDFVGQFRTIGTAIGKNLGEAIAAQLKADFKNFKWGDLFVLQQIGASADKGLRGNRDGLYWQLLREMGISEGDIEKAQARFASIDSAGQVSYDEALKRLKRNKKQGDIDAVPVKRPYDYSSPRESVSGYKPPTAEEKLLEIQKTEEQRKKDEEKRAKEREELYKNELAARIGILRGHLADAEKAFNAAQEKARDAFKKTGDRGAFITSANEASARLTKEAAAIVPLLDESIRQQTLKEKKGAAERQQIFEEENRLKLDLQDRVNAEIEKNNETLAEAEKKAAEKRVTQTQQSLQRALETTAAMREADMLRKERDLAQGLLTEEDYNKARRISEADFLIYRENNLAQQLEAVKGNAEEEAKIRHELALLKIEIEKQLTEDTIEEIKRRNEEIRKINQGVGGEEGRDSSFGRISPIFGGTGNEREEGSGGGLSDVQQDRGIFGTIAEGLGGLIGGGLDIGGSIKTEAETIKAVYADLKATAADSIGSMVSGLASLVEQWALTGKFSAKAALAMAAGVVTGLAIQSGIKALFHLAEGFASLAIFDAKGAAMHFAAAKIYGLVAAGAGVAGIALGAAARSMESGNSSGALASQTAPGATTRGVSPTNQTRIIEENRLRRQEDNERRGSITGTLAVELRVPPGTVDQGVMEMINNRTEGFERLKLVINEG